MSLEILTEMSNRYGRDEEYVLAGGGNTSFKEDGKLYVKGSGVALSEIKPEQFVVMDLNKLLKMVSPDYYPGLNQSERESKALEDMMASKLPGEESKRPSVESVLHALFPFKYVLHVHPPLINGITCGKDGKKVCIELFGEKAVWIDLVKPGLTLAETCKKQFNENEAKTGKHPQIIILQNHGIFIAADEIDEIDKLMDFVIANINEKVTEKPLFDEVPYDKDLAQKITEELKKLYIKDGLAEVIFCTNKQVQKFTESKEAFFPVSNSLTPDHIVNCKDEALFIETGADSEDSANIAKDISADIKKEFETYETKKGYKPKIIAVENLGFFALSEDQKNAQRAKALFLDTIKIVTYTQPFGGINPLPPDFTHFILTWEAESYRSKI